MKILVTGANGQVGDAVKHVLITRNIPFIAAGRDQLDITCQQQVNDFSSEIKPTVIINCAGYTRVDQAESEADKAVAVNCEGVAYLATYCKAQRIPLIHLSTDYVFDGKLNRAYQVEDQPCPLNVYGKSKWQGELVLKEIWQQHIIVRTSWVFGRCGDNFVKKILELGRTRETLNVVSDQIGCPTFAGDLANFLVQVALHVTTNSFDKWGTYHYCGAPAVSWYEFAKAIFHHAKKSGRLAIKEVHPILAEHYPSPAKRPHYSVLDMQALAAVFPLPPSDWNLGLQLLLPELMKQNEEAL